MWGKSVVACAGECERERCGYCKHSDLSSLSCSFGIWAYVLDVRHYNDLLDRGMRRSGKYLYKPTIARTCCPQYTIRLNVQKFYLSKSQKKVLRRMNEFLRNGRTPKLVVEDVECEVDRGVDKEKALSGTSATTSIDVEDGTTRVSSTALVEDGKFIKKPSNFLNVSHVSPANRDILGLEASKITVQTDPLVSNTSNQTGKVVNDESTEESLASGCNVSAVHSSGQKKKKLIRKERALMKMRRMKISDEEAVQLHAAAEANKKKTLETYINDCESHILFAAHKLKIDLVRVDSREYIDTKEESFNLFRKYQSTVHLETSCSMEEFENFLGNSPLERAPHPLGTYHMQYRLDGKLLAVGVLDLLPRCVSAVYFFYDPEYKFLSLGTYAALREIYLAQTLSKDIPGLDYYYMGYYIESCPKMRYKGQFRPSELLCDTSFTWVSFEECKKLLSQSSRVLAFAKDALPAALVPYGSMLCLYRGCLGKYSELPSALEVVDAEDDVKKYAAIVGSVGQQMILVIT